MNLFLKSSFFLLFPLGISCQSHHVQPPPIKPQPIVTSQPAPLPAPELPKEPPDYLFLIEVDRLCGFIDRAGKVVIPPQFGFNTGSFSGGLASVQVLDPDPMKPSKIGFIDLQGEMVIPPQFSEASSFADGIAFVQVDDKYGIIDRTGKFLVPLQSTPLYNSYSDGLELVQDTDGSNYFIDKTGKVVIKPRPGVEYLPFSEGFALAAWGDDIMNRTCRYMNRKGQFVFPHLKGLDNACDFSEGMAAVSFNGSNKYGYINTKGKFVIPQILECEVEPPDSLAGYIVPSSSSFSEGLAVAMKKGKYGYINKTGKFVIQPQFDKAYSFSHDLAFVSKDGESFFIDKKGKRAITPEKDSRSNQNFSPFINGLAQDNIGYIDKTGKYVWKCPEGKQCWS